MGYKIDPSGSGVDHGANAAMAALWSAVCSEPAGEVLFILADQDSMDHTACSLVKGVPL